MTLFDFMAGSPWLALFIAFMICETIFRIINRFLRHLNIRSKGWPPAHLDADGDFKPEEEKQ